MNILVIEDAASSTFGGAERTMRSYCEHLSKSHRLHLVYDRAGDYSRDLSDIYATVTRISLHPLRVQPALTWQKELLRLVRLCRREKIDLILTHVVHALSTLRMVRLLSHTRTVFIFKWVCSTEQVGWQARWGLKGIESGISVSSFVAGYWIKNGFPEHKMCVIPEGISMDDESGNPRVDPSRPKEPLTVGFAGRIVPEKGLHILIDAIAQFKATGKPIKCLVAGVFDAERNGSSYHSAIQKQVYDLGLVADVDFLGYITPLTGFIRQIDVMVVPSICQDAQPIVLLESMVTGTPVIASQVGGVPEMMTGPLETWVVASNSSSRLFAKLVEFDALTTRERAQLGQFVRRYAATNYSIEACHQRLTERIVLQPNACTA
jgi:glycosyltransferase involved in cell wall biosynthesis